MPCNSSIADLFFSNDCSFSFFKNHLYTASQDFETSMVLHTTSSAYLLCSSTLFLHFCVRACIRAKLRKKMDRNLPVMFFFPNYRPLISSSSSIQLEIAIPQLDNSRQI